MAILSLPCGYKLKDILGIFQPRFISFGAERKIVWLRFENRSAEIDFSIGWETFSVLRRLIFRAAQSGFCYVFSQNFHFTRQYFIILSHFGIEKTVWSAQTAFKLYAMGILTQHLLQQRRNPQGNHCRLSSIVIVLYTAITSVKIEISDQVCMVLYRNKQKPSCMLVILLLHRKTGYNLWL